MAASLTTSLIHALRFSSEFARCSVPSPSKSSILFPSSSPTFPAEKRAKNSKFTNVNLLRNRPRSLLDSDKTSAVEGSDPPPPGCSRFKVELGRPLGIAFEETKIGTIIVGEVISGGNADKSGLVEAGDQLIATSAIIYSDTEEYQGVNVRKGMQIVRLNVRGERFETVMAAIGTHPAYIKVTLEFQKCDPLKQMGQLQMGGLGTSTCIYSCTQMKFVICFSLASIHDRVLNSVMFLYVQDVI